MMMGTRSVRRATGFVCEIVGDVGLYCIPGIGGYGACKADTLALDKGSNEAWWC